MPSSTPYVQAAKTLQPATSAFRAAVVAAFDELSAFLTAQRAPREQRVAREAAMLGDFAASHIDVARFAALTGTAEIMDRLRLGRLEQAEDVLAEFIGRRDELYHVVVKPGGDLRDAVRDALAYRGRVFHAAHAVELLRSGATLTEPVGEALDFRAWSKQQRALAPPLIVEVAGTDLQVDGLGEYLDGSQKIALLVHGPAAPAPLARLLVPGRFVLQTNRVEDLALLADIPGPGIAAVLPDSCARFTHDPRRGAQLRQRLHADFIPEPLTVAVAGGSLGQQVQDLAWLGELVRVAATSVPATNGAPEPVPEAAPADRLAAWLLRHTDLTQPQE